MLVSNNGVHNYLVTQVQKLISQSFVAVILQVYVWHKCNNVLNGN